MTEWVCNDAVVDTIRIDDRSVQYGDGLFETVAVRDGTPRLWKYHVDRLQTGCARLGLAVPGETSLRRALSSALAATSLDADNCVAKILLSAGPGPRGYRRDADARPTLLVGISEARPVSVERYRDGVTVRLCNTRLPACEQLAGIKSLNRLEQVLARAEWREASVFEGLTLDTGDRLICGTMSNVFLLDEHSLLTPAITRCGVAGVMRRHLLALLVRHGIDCEVRDIAVDELWSCHGVILTNSQFGALPVARCGRKAWRQNRLLQRLMRLLAKSGIRECAV